MQQLTSDRLQWFQEITGLPLHAFWHQPRASHGSTSAPLCPTARDRLKSGEPLSAACQLCCDQCWTPALSLTVAPESFTGHCGLANCSATLEWKHTRPLTLVLQIRLKQNHEPSKAAQTFSSVSIAPGSGSDTNARAPVHRWATPNAAATFPAAFQRAVTLLRLLHHDLQITAQNHLLLENQARTRLLVQHLELEHARSRQGLHGCCQDGSLASARQNTGNHSEHVVQAMLDWVGQHYHRPLSLDELAHALRMNPSYLSTLFHRTTGVAFHHYLEELRMSKAQELLRDPLIRICEVAGAVGYASPEHFRHAFKAREGRAPNAWRQSMPRPESP